MLSIYDAASAAAVLAQPLNPTLRTLIDERLTDAHAIGLADQTHILVIEPGDTEETIQAEIGWAPVTHPVEGCRYGTVDFIPYWAWLQDVGGWYELLHTVGNDGFAYILLIEDRAGAPSDLLGMCRHFAGEGA